MTRSIDLSVVIPVLNDQSCLENLLNTLARYRLDNAEIIVVDGGSTDRTREIAALAGVRLVSSEAGRGNQLQAGFRASTGSLVLMLHADSGVSSDLFYEITKIIKSRINRGEQCWGRFKASLFSDVYPRSLWIIAAAMEMRSRATSICTGDQGIFVSRELLLKVGGIPEQPLMEDIELSKRLRAHIRPVIISKLIHASPRKWEDDGLVRTVLRMWIYRARYFFGGDPELLSRDYYK